MKFIRRSGRVGGQSSRWPRRSSEGVEGQEALTVDQCAEMTNCADDSPARPARWLPGVNFPATEGERAMRELKGELCKPLQSLPFQ